MKQAQHTHLVTPTFSHVLESHLQLLSCTSALSSLQTEKLFLDDTKLIRNISSILQAFEASSENILIANKLSLPSDSGDGEQTHALRCSAGAASSM